MTDNAPVDARDALLKKIDGKLAWICFFLILIVLNTCSVADDLEDAIRSDRREADAAASAPAAPTPPAPPQ